MLGGTVYSWSYLWSAGHHIVNYWFGLFTTTEPLWPRVLVIPRSQGCKGDARHHHRHCQQSLGDSISSSTEPGDKSTLTCGCSISRGRMVEEYSRRTIRTLLLQLRLYHDLTDDRHPTIPGVPTTRERAHHLVLPLALQCSLESPTCLASSRRHISDQVPLTMADRTSLPRLWCS
ncbi:hypothetical protein BDN67DRAFT_230622 [Paxillus ammoniavirescens]|nr:hypothetical protein BDN67DRAFT_230622 [Paxillus ammoniavirescens]